MSTPEVPVPANAAPGDQSPADPSPVSTSPVNPVPANTERSPRRGMCAAVLCLEGIALGLTTPVMITIADVPVGTALAVGLGLAVLCLLLAGMLRSSWAYSVGYAVQLAAIGLGFVISLMFLLGGIFAVLWTMADYLGRKIEREKAAAWAAYRAEQA